MVELGLGGTRELATKYPQLAVVTRSCHCLVELARWRRVGSLDLSPLVLLDAVDEEVIVQKDLNDSKIF